MNDTSKTRPQRYQPLTQDTENAPLPPSAEAAPAIAETNGKPEEIGGPSGPEPTRYGDWERKGRCVDF
ncbi:MAG: DUF1674 domain-containing protein [Cardiobacteriaceae bacterium]|nr:DUF1674 domain-containing protein [Cardiobacteriaceae bacterium]